MTVSIPVWLVWALAIVIGGPILLIFIALAVFGAMMAWALEDGIWK